MDVDVYIDVDSDVDVCIGVGASPRRGSAHQLDADLPDRGHEERSCRRLLHLQGGGGVACRGRTRPRADQSRRSLAHESGGVVAWWGDVRTEGRDRDGQIELRIDTPWRCRQ